MNHILIDNINYFYKLAVSIRPTDRVNLTTMKFDMGRFILSRDENEGNNKPNAFYYALGKQWINFSDYMEGDAYLLKLDMSKMYHLTPDNLEGFIAKYCSNVTIDDVINKMMFFARQFPTGLVVNWDKFKKDYDGMEITDLDSVKSKFRSLKLDIYMPFLNTVDVDGGFFWNPSVLKHATKIGTVEEGKVTPARILHRYRLEEDPEVGYRGEDRQSFVPKLVDESIYWRVIHKLRDGQYPFSTPFSKKFITDVFNRIRSENAADLYQVISKCKEDIPAAIYQIRSLLIKHQSKIFHDSEYSNDQLNSNLLLLCNNLLFKLFVDVSTCRAGLEAITDMVINHGHEHSNTKEAIKSTLTSIFGQLESQDLKDMTKYINYLVGRHKG